MGAVLCSYRSEAMDARRSPRGRRPCPGPDAPGSMVDGAALVPVICDQCGTLYHRACWEQSGGKCAVLGCGSTKFHVHGLDSSPVLKVKYTDLPAHSANGRSSPSAQTRRLKEEQRRQVRNMTLFERFWRWLLDQIKINP